MRAEYMMIDEETLIPLIKLEEEELSDRLMEIEESEKFPSVGLDKSWDLLHYYLTGVSASDPIEGEKLSEAVVGVHVMSYENEFIACTENKELPNIIAALENFDVAAHTIKLNVAKMKRADLYPEGIEEEDKDQLLEEIEESLRILIGFYKKALEQKQHIIVSIL
ncbi:DUF1877 family protein [Dysgonomonas sp. 511]|uniref:DUF1877 family protein n=1 Tax=Dysgonomonas sp. 511 TaxID=2302930 RepID=UPI001C8833CA|nr:DUF1877 family protein [Dysgonomonas sp. 511]